MNTHTFYWDIKPPTEAEYAITVPPFKVVVRPTGIAITISAEPADAGAGGCGVRNDDPEAAAGELTSEIPTRTVHRKRLFV
jgi:hypothetical protein